jgi:hypothetical protein
VLGEVLPGQAYVHEEILSQLETCLCMQGCALIGLLPRTQPIPCTFPSSFKVQWYHGILHPEMGDHPCQ